VLASTARLQIHNSIFWNPINVSSSKPEFQSIGEITGAGTTVFDNTLIGVFGLNPGLTPNGNIAGITSSSYRAAITRINLNVGAPIYKKDVHALRDIHGELRYRQILTGSEEAPGLVVGHSDDDRLTDTGADQWVDSDSDLIPDAFDRLPSLMENAVLDGDSDMLNELTEYLGSTSNSSADSPYLTVNQARSLFTPIGSTTDLDSFYTKAETNRLFLTKSNAALDYMTRTQANTLFVPLNPTILRTVRVAPGGNISMGAFAGQQTTP
jgi:hypothetical protein